MSPSLFNGYRVDGFFDEVFAAGGGSGASVRPHYRPLVDRLEELTPDEFALRERLRDSAFRSQGITFTVYGEEGARYVSGYLFTADDASGRDVAGDVVEVQTHAWVEVALPGAGWWPLDPTNQQAVGQRHVKIGHGRDYGDVPPLKGTFSGPPEHSLDVSVQIRRASGQQAQQ